jgi:iron complex transport system ATP-binding protein
MSGVTREGAAIGAAAAPPPNAPLVAVDDLGFAYDEKPVLRHLSLNVESGDFVGVVGPNGSGKSTLLDVIDGVLKPTSGAVTIKGQPTHGMRRRDLAREVALVPQNFALDFDLSVRDVVEMGAYCRGKDCRPREEAEAALGKLGIAELAERSFPQLSGGERQLVVLAQALVQGSRLLLLDEPASSLDVAHQLRLFDLLKQLNADGLTVICVLHDLNLALTYFDRLLVMAEGGAAAWGKADDVLRPEILESVYGVRAYMHRHAGRTFLTFSPRPRGHNRGRVHIVCGGGTGAQLMRELVDAGYEVSAGVLNALDSDEVTGRELGLSMAVEAAFSPIGENAHAENLRLAADADLVILTDVPIGHGNTRNIEAVRLSAEAGTEVWALHGVLDHDAEGHTTALRETETVFVRDADEVIARLKARAEARG